MTCVVPGRGGRVWRSAWTCPHGRSYVIEHLADPGGVLIVDDTGLPKTGSGLTGRGAVRHTAGRGGGSRHLPPRDETGNPGLRSYSGAATR